MTVVKAPPLTFAKTPIVDKAGNPNWNFLQWVSKIEQQTSVALTSVGINPNAPIAGTSVTPGTLNSKTQNLSTNGTLPANHVTGSISGSQVGFTLDQVPNGTTRFAVAQVDSANLPIINFADTAHQNKILDNVNDGTIYQRFTRVFAGQLSLSTSPITGGSNSTTTGPVAGVLSTDVMIWSFAGSPATGYSGGGLIIIPFITAGNVNFYVANPTVGSITPGAQTVNFLVIR